MATTAAAEDRRKEEARLSPGAAKRLPGVGGYERRCGQSR